LPSPFLLCNQGFLLESLFLLNGEDITFYRIRSVIESAFPNVEVVSINGERDDISQFDNEPVSIGFIERASIALADLSVVAGMTVCKTEEEFIEAGLNRVLTQYRESPKLLAVIRAHLKQVWSAHNSICNLPESFNLDTATGDQLTIIGKWMGFPRCHCVCDVQPVFGFPCEVEIPGDRPIVGLCEGAVWLACGEDGISEICITDDETYRKLLVARSYQMQSRYSWDDLTAVIKFLFGNAAKIMSSGNKIVTIAPFRELTDLETAILQIIPRVLPIAPGISTRWHFGTFEIFGFGEGWGGFCLDWLPGGLPVVTEDGNPIVDENGNPIWTGALTRDADWLCQTDLKPYSC
jgi:hypothetical protein